MTYLTTIKNTRILDWKTHKCSLSTCIANRESLTKRVQNNTKALEYALLASVNGDSITLLNTAFMYHDGLGTEVNYERAYFLQRWQKKRKETQKLQNL